MIYDECINQRKFLINKISIKSFSQKGSSGLYKEIGFRSIVLRKLFWKCYKWNEELSTTGGRNMLLILWLWEVDWNTFRVSEPLKVIYEADKFAMVPDCDLYNLYFRKGYGLLKGNRNFVHKH